MLKRVNFLPIIRDHFRTLSRLDSDSNKVSLPDLFLFIIIPIVLGLLFTFLDIAIKPYTSNLIASLSIFSGFLFNLLAIVYSQMEKLQKDAKSEKSSIKERFIKEIHINISFTIILSLIIITGLIVGMTPLPKFRFDWVLKDLYSFLIISLSSLFLLSLLMVLNRIYILLKKEVN